MERAHRMLEFNQPMAKFHAMDLCNLEHAMEDCISMADLAVPSLVVTFGPSGDDDTDMQVEVDPSARKAYAKCKKAMKEAAKLVAAGKNTGNSGKPGP